MEDRIHLIKNTSLSESLNTIMDQYFAADTKQSSSQPQQRMHQPQQSSNDEHSALAKSQIAQEWQEAKQREINRQLEQAQQNMQYEQNHLLRSSGIDPASGLKDLSARSADVLLACEPEWIKDSLCNECKICNRYFTFTKRKHHCRFCGGVVCNECSQHRALLPLRFALRETARVCIPCHQRLEPVQPMLQRLKALKHRKNTKYNPDVDQYRSQMNFPIKHTLSGEVRKAAYSVRNLYNPATLQDQSIPASLLKDAKGILFMTVFKAGFLASVRMGTGLVVAKLPNGQWSAPSAVYTAGFGFGAQAGSNVTDFVTVLMTNDSVRQFAGDMIGNIGASAGIALGTGRCAETNANVQSDGNTAATYTYSQARGLYAGIAIELGAIKTRHNVNQKFYGRNITPLEILSGREPPPVAAAPLYVELRNASQHWTTGESATQQPPEQQQQQLQFQAEDGAADSFQAK
jgi:lipid-binding SYLF domain-containing protein